MTKPKARNSKCRRQLIKGQSERKLHSTERVISTKTDDRIRAKAPRASKSAPLSHEAKTMLYDKLESTMTLDRNDQEMRKNG